MILMHLKSVQNYVSVVISWNVTMSNGFVEIDPDPSKNIFLLTLETQFKFI